jgi:hypothetical protein
MPDQPGPAPDEEPDPVRESPADGEGAPGSHDGAASDEAAAPTEAADPAGGDASDEPDAGGAAADSPAEDAAAAAAADSPAEGDADETADVPPEVRKYERFKKMDGARYERVNEFLRDRTYITAREWAIARLCADFRTETGVEMTKIGENLPELVPFMTDTYTPQAVNQARYAFEEKVTKAGATFLYGAMSGFFTAEDLDEMMYEVTEVAKFLLEVEGVDLAVADELEAEDRISEVMREVRASSADLRGEEVRCPECGHVHEPADE